MSAYCDFAPNHPIHGPYHDHEYGFPIADDRALFERLCLEVFQAGLSWEIVLKKRSALNAAFQNFQPEIVAAFGPLDEERLMADASIIRNRAKIKATIFNAGIFLELSRQNGGFAHFLKAQGQLPLEQWVKTMRKHFKFMGPEVVNEFLMSISLLPGAHRPDCPVQSCIDAALSQGA